MSSRRLLTLGHGTLAAEDFLALIRSAEITRIVDVRSFPGSRRNPQFGRETMAEWLEQAGVDYVWEQRLGGRRRGVGERTAHLGLRHPSFRAYADWMETEEFRAGLSTLAEPAAGQSAVMCSESLWWRCHRRLLSDYVVLVERAEVRHLMHDGRLQDHPLTPEARLVAAEETATGQAMVVYDGDQPPLSASSPA
ncbi:DUF488 family protein [Ruania zhangjianzhongii]|uniref:DUF488 domain-containing protein n=1 Tax=Ruania zhangjianzhongii TaxID=2603206 RepID=UPI0011C95BB7|nr:DUF488 domain-containing protein [Ruania zhangjianzhongii]